MVRHKAAKLLDSFLRYFIYFFDTLYFCKTIFYLMILVNFFEHLLYSWYILLFWDTWYYFQILSNFWNTWKSFRYFLILWSLHTFSKTILLEALWFWNMPIFWDLFFDTFLAFGTRQQFWEVKIVGFCSNITLSYRVKEETQEPHDRVVFKNHCRPL